MGVKKGFSLIELSVAIVVLILICSGILGIISQGIFNLRRSQERSVAYSLAREVLERYFNWAALPANGTYQNPPPYPATINNVTYNVSLRVADGPVAVNQLKEIEVAVSWGNQSYRLYCFKAYY